MRRTALVALALAVLPAAAWANCAEPAGYIVEARPDGTVVVQHRPSGTRACGDGEAMLRQQVTTGVTVRLAEYCGEGNPATFLDECVPAGHYRYGYQTPDSCHTSACGGGRRWQEVVVAAPPTNCTPDAGNPGPTAVAPIGWTADSQDLCVSGPLGCGCTSAGGAAPVVLVANALALTVGWALRRRRRS